MCSWLARTQGRLPEGPDQNQNLQIMRMQLLPSALNCQYQTSSYRLLVSHYPQTCQTWEENEINFHKTGQRREAVVALSETTLR